MALTNQPYFPFYVDDYLSDEKLAECSIQAEGIYTRIMCFMHKSEFYGKIKIQAIDKLKYKQKSSKIQANEEQKEVLSIIGLNEADFAILVFKVQNLIKRDFDTIYAGLLDLLVYGVLSYKDGFLSQKRMVKDGEKSIKRANAGSKGGKSIKQKESKEKANQQQIPVIGVVNEYENENEKKCVPKFEELKPKLLEDEIFCDSVKKLHGFKKDSEKDEAMFEKMIDDFLLTKKAIEKDKWKSYEDFRTNFFHWVPKRILNYKPSNSKFGSYTAYEYEKLLKDPYTVKKQVNGTIELVLDKNGQARYSEPPERRTNKNGQKIEDPRLEQLIKNLTNE